MHEMGLAQAILAVTVDIAGSRPVRRVAVSVGEHQAVNADSLEFSFQLIAEGTTAAGATVGVRTVPGDRVLVDEVEVGGDEPALIRRSDSEVVEPAHDHSHEPDDQTPVHPAWL